MVYGEFRMASCATDITQYQFCGFTNSMAKKRGKGSKETERGHRRRSSPLERLSDDLIDISYGAIKRVLVLDDDEDLTYVLTAILESNGYEVTTVNTAVDGLVPIMVCDFDAIICDMVMPKMPGDMYYYAVAQAKPHLCSRFVFITGHGSNPKIAKFLSEVERPILHKPFGMDELLEVVLETTENTDESGDGSARHTALKAELCAAFPPRPWLKDGSF